MTNYLFIFDCQKLVTGMSTKLKNGIQEKLSKLFTLKIFGTTMIARIWS
jgi:hypothetical protein